MRSRSAMLFRVISTTETQMAASRLKTKLRNRNGYASQCRMKPTRLSRTQSNIKPTWARTKIQLPTSRAKSEATRSVKVSLRSTSRLRSRTGGWSCWCLIRSRAMSSISLPIDIWPSSGVAAMNLQLNSLGQRTHTWLQKVRVRLNLDGSPHEKKWDPAPALATCVQGRQGGIQPRLADCLDHQAGFLQS